MKCSIQISRSYPVHHVLEHYSSHGISRGGGGKLDNLSDKAASGGHDKRNTCIYEVEDNIKAVFKGVGSWNVGWFIKIQFWIERRDLVKGNKP